LTALEYRGYRLESEINGSFTLSAASCIWRSGGPAVRRSAGQRGEGPREKLGPRADESDGNFSEAWPPTPRAPIESPREFVSAAHSQASVHSLLLSPAFLRTLLGPRARTFRAGRVFRRPANSPGPFDSGPRAERRKNFGRPNIFHPERQFYTGSGST
jgi:hypothetical protein